MSSIPSYIRPCQHCGDPFATPNKARCYCSETCRLVHRFGPPKICPECNHLFQPQHKTQERCSPRCARRAPRKAPRPVGPCYTRTCKHCKEVFSTADGSQRYCCEGCRLIHRFGPPRVCPRCGTLFQPRHKNPTRCARHCPSVLPCSVPGCPEPRFGLGYCNIHYISYAKYGDPLKARRRRIKKPGERLDRLHQGYAFVKMPGHPNANKDGLVKEHTYVMSQVLGRGLRKGETVHHKNGIRDDNRPQNLELWSRNHGDGQRVADQIAWALQLLRSYADQPALWPQGIDPRTFA